MEMQEGCGRVAIEFRKVAVELREGFVRVAMEMQEGFGRVAIEMREGCERVGLQSLFPRAG
jgi:hypothetical protein